MSAGRLSTLKDSFFAAVAERFSPPLNTSSTVLNGAVSTSPSPMSTGNVSSPTLPMQNGTIFSSSSPMHNESASSSSSFVVTASQEAWLDEIDPVWIIATESKSLSIGGTLIEAQGLCDLIRFVQSSSLKPDLKEAALAELINATYLQTLQQAKNYLYFRKLGVNVTEAKEFIKLNRSQSYVYYRKLGANDTEANEFIKLKRSEEYILAFLGLREVGLNTDQAREYIELNERQPGDVSKMSLTRVLLLGLINKAYTKEKLLERLVAMRECADLLRRALQPRRP